MTAKNLDQRLDIRIDGNTLSNLDLLARYEQRSRSDMVRLLINAALNRLQHHRQTTDQPIYMTPMELSIESELVPSTH